MMRLRLAIFDLSVEYVDSHGALALPWVLDASILHVEKDVYNGSCPFVVGYHLVLSQFYLTALVLSGLQ